MNRHISPWRPAPTKVLALAALFTRVSAMQIKEVRVNGSQPGGGDDLEVPTDADPCAGCELTVNLKCDGIRSARSAAFHRIQDCLVPLYGLIEVARNASVFENKRVCAVTWVVAWEGLNLMPFLQNLSGVQWHSIIDERDKCSKQLEYHTVNRTARQMASADYIAKFGSDKNMVKAYPIDPVRNLRIMRADVFKMTHNERDRTILVISRKSGTRMFRPVATQELISGLRDTGWPVVEYFGRESAMETVKLFTSAAGIIGYHGAAWVNTYFSVRFTCNMQVSTFFDLKSTQPWRINKELLVNPLLVWYFYYLPLGMLLDANHVHHQDYIAREEKDHFIKDLEWIPLRTTDISDLVDHMDSCLDDPYAYREVHKKPEAQIATFGWESEPLVEPAPANAKLLSSTRDECSGCDVTVDLRCQDLELNRSWYYSRVARCLLPAYEMVQVAREAASNRSAHVCAITWSQGFFSVAPFLESLVDIRWHKILYEEDACVGGLAYHAINRTVEQGASQRWVSNFNQRLDGRLIQAYPVNLQHNLVWMQKDAVNIAGQPSPHVVIIQNYESKRLLPPESMDKMTSTLSKFLKMDVSVFSGEGTVTEMLKRFTNLAIVMGFWNELWVNTLFTYTPHCVVQFSTYMDFEKTTKWRTSAEIQSLNPAGEWRFNHVPLQEILKGNGKHKHEYLAAPDKDEFLKNLEWAPIPEQNIMDMSRRTYLCWQNKGRGYRWMTESWGWHGHA